MEELGRRIRIFSFEALSRKKDAGADPDIKEYIKGQRKLFKDYIGRLNDKIFLKDDEGNICRHAGGRHPDTDFT